MSNEIEYLELEDVVALATILLGDPLPIRDIGLLGSAVARPRTSAFGQDAYPDLLTKAAALLQSIVNNHALIDGNKRLGWLSTAVYMEINGMKALRISNDDVYNFVIWIASTSPPIEEIVGKLRLLFA